MFSTFCRLDLEELRWHWTLVMRDPDFAKKTAEGQHELTVEFVNEGFEYAFRIHVAQLEPDSRLMSPESPGNGPLH